MSLSARVLSVSGVVVGAVAVLGNAPAAPRWEIDVLPVLSTPVGDLVHIWARDINERGQVAGTAEGVQGSALFRYTPGTGMEDLDPDGSYRSRAYIGSSINNRGHVLGRRFDSQRRQSDVFLHRGKRGFDDLAKGKTALVAGAFETFGGQTFIPDDGHFCGSVRVQHPDGSFSRRAYLYSRRSGWVDLATLDSRFANDDVGVFCKYTNQRGDLVFSIAGPAGTQEAFARIGRTPVVEIPSFELGMNTTAEPNANGTVVGIYRTSVGDDPFYNLRAYIWTREAGLVSLHPADVGESQALFVSDRSEVWGILSTDGIVQTATGQLVGHSDKVFLYRPSSGMNVVLEKDDFDAIADRHGLVFRDMSLSGANNRGAVVGHVVVGPAPGGRDQLLPFYYSRRSGLVDLAAVVDEIGGDFVLDPARNAGAVDVTDRGDVLVQGASRSTGAIRSAILRLRRR